MKIKNKCYMCLEFGHEKFDFFYISTLAMGQWFHWQIFAISCYCENCNPLPLVHIAGLLAGDSSGICSVYLDILLAYVHISYQCGIFS